MMSIKCYSVIVPICITAYIVYITCWSDIHGPVVSLQTVQMGSNFKQNTNIVHNGFKRTNLSLDIFCHFGEFHALANQVPIRVYSFTLRRQYRVVKNRYSRLLFTSEGRLYPNLRVREQSTNMTSQYRYTTFAWRHRSTVVTSQC